MENPRQRYIKGHGFHSSSKSSFSSFSKHNRDRSSKFSNSHRSSTSFKSNNRRFNSQELPLHLKRPFKMSSTPVNSPKMSSPKRAHPDDHSHGRSPKQQKVKKDDKGPHGLEDFLASAPILAPISETVSSFTPQYTRRDKFTNYRRTLRQKQALAKAVRSEAKGMRPSLQRGMLNLTGDLCYRHSLFQALLHSRKFCNWLFYDHRPRDCFANESGECVACAIRKLAIVYWGNADLTTELKIINKLFAKLKWSPAGDGRLTGQGDSEGQFTWIMEQMREQLTKKTFRSYEASHCIVTDSGVNCQCGHSSVSENNLEGFIPIDLAEKVPYSSLSRYLDNHFNTQVSGYRCAKCNNNTASKSRTQRVAHFPDNLVFQLKRFSWDGSKNSKAIKYEEVLDLERFRSEKTTSGAKYELSAVVAHAGTTNYGHYICYAKDRDEQWIKFNDDVISRSNVANVLAPPGGFTPYLLFYQREEEEEVVEEVVENATEKPKKEEKDDKE